MRKGALLLILFATIFKVAAQNSMTVEVPPSGVLLKSQLWNVLVVNSSGGSNIATFGLTITDLVSSQQVMTAVSMPFTLVAGNNQLQASLLSLSYEYLSPMMTDHDPYGFLAAGNFEVCYTLTVSGHESQPLQDCINISVEPISPILLQLPEDESESQRNTPEFIWTPPAPLNLFDNLTYRFTLVSVQSSQTPAEAIEQNIPIYTTNNLTDIFLNYPSSIEPLDTGQLYAWQVQVLNDNEYACQSDVWTYSIKPTAIDTILTVANPYIALKRYSDASMADSYNDLSIDYKNENADTTAPFTITSLSDDDFGTVIKMGKLVLTPGENLQKVTLNNALSDGSPYLFELENSRNEVWSVKFIYHISKN